MAGLPTGTVTFLFADTIRSSHPPKRLGNRDADVLDEYQRILRAAFEKGGGQEVGSEGAALLVAFRSARDAVAAAVAAQCAIGTQLRSAHKSPPRVRMGLSTDPTPTARAPATLDSHPAVHVCSAGYGGQILLAEPTHALVDDDLPAKVSLRDLGVHRLRDLQRSEHLFQVVHPDLPADFPSLMSLDTLPNNLPIQLTSFVGREQEMADVRRHLAGTRLLTLTGVGGCGKTRLALQATADILEEYPDGAWLVELAPLSESLLVPQMVATALGVPEQPNRPLIETVVQHLRSKTLLLLLDGCEHLLAACAQVITTLLRRCPTTRILVTSQEALGVAGELTYPVPPLSLPPDGGAPSLEALVQSEAVRLFVERAAFSQPGFALASGNASAVSQVCRRLDGMPLAIELAAARVRVLTTEQIAARLHDRFRLLAGGDRTALPRHQALRAVMDWSYDLLVREEQALLRRLSVFAGGWTLEAAEFICSGNGLEASGILDLLVRLVDKSLVVAETHGGEGRYRLLETVRQYGRDRLLETGESAEIRRRHRNWYLGLAERADAELRGPRQGEWLRRLETEHDNLRVALEWSRTDSGDPAAALRLAGALYWFWFIHGHWSEGRGWLENALSRSSTAFARGLPKVLLGGAHLARQQGDYQLATELSERGLALSRDLEDTPLIPWFLINLGLVASYQGDGAKATALFEQSLALSRDLGDRWLTSMSLAQLGGIVATAKRDYQRAAALLTESLALSEEVGDKYRIAFALRGLGAIALRQGDYEGATARYQAGLALSREVREGWVTEECLAGLAGVACGLGYCKRAAQLFGAAEALRETLGLHRLAVDQADYDQRVAAARAGLGGDAFRAAWTEGRSMTLDQATEVAMVPMETVPSPAKGAESAKGREPADLLTRRERDVAALIARGQTNREIAESLFISGRTADTHVQHILNKLGFDSRTQIAAWAVEHRLTTSRD